METGDSIVVALLVAADMRRRRQTMGPLGI
jgi:hypothetical protein